MDKSTIAILHYASPPVVGGVEAVIQAHLDVFTEHDHPVRVIAGRGERDRYPAGAELCVVPEMDSQHPAVVKISANLEKGIVPADFYTLTDQLEAAIGPFIKGINHLIVHNLFTKHFNLPLTAALYRLLDKGVGQGCIAWCHDFTWTSPNSRSRVHPGYPWDLLRTKRSDTRYVVVSKQRQATLAELFNCALDEIRVVYNGVDPKALLGLTEAGWALIDRLGLFESDLIMLMPVRVTKAKNIELALRVVAALKAMGYRPKLLVTGPPDPHDSDNMTYYDSLKKLRAELGVEDEMRFVFESGPQDGDGFIIDLALVGELFRVSDLIFMPSHREGFGMPVLEAGLAGVPIMAAEIPAAVEIGQEEVVLIGKSMSPETIGEKILALTMDNPVYRLRRRVRDSYTWEAIYRQEIQPLLREKTNGP
jgi:glycosyltransferase involved in cell wall biosynthesis